jgi:hypothetical protein
MAQNLYIASATFSPVASGPGNATIQFEDAPGEWAVHNSVIPTGIFVNMTLESGKPYSLALVAGEYLHIRGRGNAFVIADTLV